MGHFTRDAVDEMNARPSRIHFICAVNKEEVFQRVLLRSLEQNRHASLTKVVGAGSAAEAFNAHVGSHPRDAITVLVHQDVYLPPGWTDRMEAIFDHTAFGVAGCVGATSAGFFADVYASPNHYLDFNIGSLPAPVDSLDELLLAFPSNTPIRLSPELGWHMYGAEACTLAQMHGLPALAIRNQVAHLCQRENYEPSADLTFLRSARAYFAKYRRPVKTTMTFIDADGNLVFPTGHVLLASTALPTPT